jgi:cytochrome c oxidase cbb3-type subunit 3
VLVDEPVNELTDHNYDGIQEYDNPTPGWWHLMFLGSVVFAVLYVFVYHMSGIVPSLPKRLANAETAALELRFAELNTMPMGEAKILRILNQEQWLDQGATIYAGTCAVCHNANGSGGIGPNLTDETYKNIASLMDISDLVLNGTPNGAMPSQRNFMNENEVALVSAYAASLRGKNLPSSPNVKPEYEGVPIPAWPTIDDDGNVIPAPTTQASNR